MKRLSRNDDYISRAPEGLPVARLIRRGSSGAIDALSGGYCVVYGRHRSGCEIALQDLDIPPPAAPQWVLDWIEERAKAHEQASVAMEASTSGPTGQPPVRLRPTAMEWWTGAKIKDEDRSATLYQIGVFLAEANAGAAVIADALAERDATLGYRKFSNRKDAIRQYAAIAQKAIAAQTRRDEPRLRNNKPPPPYLNGRPQA